METGTRRRHRERPCDDKGSRKARDTKDGQPPPETRKRTGKILP